MSESLPTDGLALLNIKDNKQLKKFYSKWSVNASKLIKKYAQEHSLNWFNTKWKNKSKEIPFYIRLKAPKSFIGNIWFASKPTNYAFGKGISKYKVVQRPFPQDFKVKPVNAYGRWFTPKTYKPDIPDINKTIASNDEGSCRYFVSQTSHSKSHKYKKPLLWFQDRSTKKVGPVTLKEQLADKISNDNETYNLIMDAFNMTVQLFE